MSTIGKPIRKLSEIAVLLDAPLDADVVGQAPGPGATGTTGAAAPATPTPSAIATVMVITQPANPGDVQLIAALRQLLANSYTMYLSAHAAHWNIEGCVFPAWHEFFGDLYADVFSAIDPFAEAIRQHGAYAPTSFAETLNAVTALPPQFEGGAKEPMLVVLLELNGVVMATLKLVKVAAEGVGDDGLSNFCQDRLAAHLKHEWMLRSMGK